MDILMSHSHKNNIKFIDLHALYQFLSKYIRSFSFKILINYSLCKDDLQEKKLLDKH
ncbi:MAG: hypothetical protein RBS16_05255 [Candidatus Cloacimonadales bacterium]|nr:hypothetical protein [Candidatus Cloacimonadota bacterium]MDX9977426.1 hypothetical protein [Candidatus Cloacimonadales bacterium]